MKCDCCGEEVLAGAKFCIHCGNVLPQEVYAGTGNTAVGTQGTHIAKFTGEERVFPILGQELHISKELDAFVYYRNAFKKYARAQADLAKKEYFEKVHNLDQFFEIFPGIYYEHLNNMLTAAFEIIFQYGIYDITPEDFATQHTKDFCATDATFKTMQEAFNNTVIANENRIHNIYNHIPNIGFIGGLGTVLAVEAANFAINTSYQSIINNVNVKPAQKAELFNRIKPEVLMHQVYKDYWDVAFSLCYRLHTHGCGVWYPTVEGNERANGLMQNLQSGFIPLFERVNVILQIFNYRPIQDSLFGYLRSNYPEDEEIEAVRVYFGYV